MWFLAASGVGAPGAVFYFPNNENRCLGFSNPMKAD